MADHEHGKMDTTEHEKTFAGFVRLASYVAVGSLLLLVFIALVNG